MSRILASIALTLVLAGGALAAPKSKADAGGDFATKFFAEMQRNIGG